jgi:hypothetical protein
MIKRRSIIGIIGAALLAPKACFAQKQLLPETQMIIDVINSWNLKVTDINFFINAHLHKQELAGIYFWVFNDAIQKADIVMWPISGVDPVVVLKELASYFGGGITCGSSKVRVGRSGTDYCYALKVFID